MKLKQTLAALTATTLFAIPSVAGAETIENMPQSQKVVAETKTLYDIQNHWAKSSIEYLVSQKIIDGYPDGTFHPDNHITREEAIKVIVTALKLEVKSQKSKFPDVKEGYWAEEYINTAKDASIITGYPDGSFGLGRNLTRGEMASMLVRAFDLKPSKDETDTTLPYSDMKKSHWAYKDILTLYQNGTISGYPDGTFHPEKEVTRAEFASSVARILQNSDKNKDEQQVKFIDFSINGNLEVGQEKPITFVLEYADGSKKDVTNKATYKVENTDIAVISNQKIKGLKEGKTKMTATYGDTVAEYYIEVVKPDSSDSQQSGASEYKDGEQKTIKGFVFTYHVNGNNWTDESGVSYDELPTFSDEVKTGEYLLRVPSQYYDEVLYVQALINIADSGVPLTKDEFINAYKEVVKTKKDVVINNVRFTYSPSDSGGDEDYVLMIVG